MISSDVENRISITEIIDHPWFNKELDYMDDYTLTEEQVQQ